METATATATATAMATAVELNDSALAPIQSQAQTQMDILMGILEDNQERIPEGDYLRGMNALGSLHKTKCRSEFMAGKEYMTHEDVCDDDQMFDRVMEVAEGIVSELCGGSLVDDEEWERLVDPGEESTLFVLLINYRPVEGNAGFGVEPTVLHHALQFIYSRLVSEMSTELSNIRPAVCSCGWRGTQRNWDRHTRNRRHILWAEKQRMFNPESESESDSDSDADDYSNRTVEGEDTATRMDNTGTGTGTGTDTVTDTASN